MDSSTALEAWRRYTSTGALESSLLRDVVFRSWERAHSQGASPHQLMAEHLSDAELSLLLHSAANLIGAARPYIGALSQAAGANRHAVMLGDARAVVLDVVGDEASIHGPERVPGPGALLSEAVSGTNGIGTPLAEGGYAELVGSEHFIGGFHLFTCQGVPLRGPDGEIGGVLSISMRNTSAAMRLRDILVCAAHGIEAELLRLRLEEDIRLVLHEGDRGEAALEKLRQDLMQIQAAARLRLQGAAALLGRDRFENALRLLQIAQSAAQEFQRRGRMFRELASSEQGVEQAVELDEQVRQLLLLLSTEAAVRDIHLVAERLVPCTVEADPRRLARQLLEHLLQAFEVAAGGGAVLVESHPHGGAGRLVVTAQPATGSRGEPLVTTLELPLRGALV